jgi:hypothetical protein
VLLGDPPVRAQPRAQQGPESLHCVDMDLVEAIAIFVAGVLASAVTNALVLVAPLWQARVDIVLIRQDEGAGQDRLRDQRLYGFLPYVFQHPYHNLAAALDHAEDRGLFLFERAPPACAFKAVAPPLTAFFLLPLDVLCDQPRHRLHRTRQLPAGALAACAGRLPLAAERPLHAHHLC